MENECYIISYQLSTQKDTALLHNAIKSYGTWAKINEHTWAVVTTKSAKDVRDHLRTFFNQSDYLFVIKSGIEAAWSNVACTSEWLKNNL